MIFQGLSFLEGLFSNEEFEDRPSSVTREAFAVHPHFNPTVRFSSNLLTTDGAYPNSASLEICVAQGRQVVLKLDPSPIGWKGDERRQPDEGVRRNTDDKQN